MKSGVTNSTASIMLTLLNNPNVADGVRNDAARTVAEYLKEHGIQINSVSVEPEEQGLEITPSKPEEKPRLRG